MRNVYNKFLAIYRGFLFQRNLFIKKLFFVGVKRNVERRNVIDKKVARVTFPQAGTGELKSLTAFCAKDFYFYSFQLIFLMHYYVKLPSVLSSPTITSCVPVYRWIRPWKSCYKKILSQHSNNISSHTIPIVRNTEYCSWQRRFYEVSEIINWE